MADKIKTPGVYIQENNSFPNSVIPIETAVPAFLGYTQKASFQGKSLLLRPIRISSFTEFIQFFGEESKIKYRLIKEEQSNENNFSVAEKFYNIETDNNPSFHLFNALKLFFMNGGNNCVIVSVGTFENETITPEFSINTFTKGLKTLEKEAVPSLLVVPDAVLFNKMDCFSLQRELLKHCGEQKNRFAILDIHNGKTGLNTSLNNPIEDFRNNIGEAYLNYGSAYYPWLNTTLYSDSDASYEHLSKNSREILTVICENYIATLDQYKQESLTPLIEIIKGESSAKNSSIKPRAIEVNNILATSIPAYKIIMEMLLKQMNCQPPSGAIAGIYALTDLQQGVWKAPANVAISGISSPTVSIDHEQQEDLNAPILGKAICAIRPFIGLGTMVWGARTLDANSLDWRYINVRRTIIMLEQSIKFAVQAFVFEPNNKNTWISIEAMVSNFLTNMWKQGALAGATPSDAFSVNVGLGTTMTATDILEGIMRIEVKVAVSRPAEFIVITFEQQMQSS